MEELWSNISGFFVEQLPNLIAPAAVLVLGWIVALIIRGVVRRVLTRTRVDEKVAGWIVGAERAKEIDTGRWVSRVVYYVLLLFVFLAFLQTLDLTVATEPINAFLSNVFAYLPKLIGALLILLVAWIIATILRKLVTIALQKTKVDERLGGEAAGEGATVPASKTVGDTVYWLVLLLFLPAILGALALEGLMEPIDGMIEKVLGFLPNLLSAAIIFVVGWFAARIVQRILANLLAAAGFDRLSERIGVARALGTRKLSAIVGLVAQVLILVPIAIAALDALQLEAVTRPASDMLGLIFEALPALFGAILILVLSFVIGRFVGDFIAGFLSGVGFDSILVRIGLTRSEPGGDARTPSWLVGKLVLVGILLLAAIEAASMLDFAIVAELIGEFTVLASRVLFGLLIFGVGLYLANLAARALAASNVAQAALLSIVARIAVLVLSGAMALRQMGLANEIITLGFGLLVGALAVAAAIAFGIGGREAAARTIEEWRQKARSTAAQRPPKPPAE